MKRILLLLIAIVMIFTACNNTQPQEKIKYNWDDVIEFEHIEFQLPDCFSRDVEKNGDNIIYASPDDSVIMIFTKQSVDNDVSWWKEILSNFKGYEKYRKKFSKEYTFNGLLMERHDFTFEVEKRSDELNHIGIIVDPDIYRLNNICFAVGENAYTVTTCIKESEYEDKAYYVLRFFDSLNILQQLQ